MADETFEELHDVTKETLFSVLDNMVVVRRMYDGFWDDKKARIFHIKRKLEISLMEVQHIAENLKDAMRLLDDENGSLVDDDENRRFENTVVIPTTTYKPNSGLVDMEEHFSAVKMENITI